MSEREVDDDNGDIAEWLRADAIASETEEIDPAKEPRLIQWPTRAKDPARSLMFRERFERGRQNAETHMRLWMSGNGTENCPCLRCRYKRGTPVK